MKIENQKELLNEPEGHKHDKELLLEAVRANMLWFIAETDGLGSHTDRMNLCSYAQWTARRALGLPHAEEWRCVPQLIFTFNKD